MDISVLLLTLNEEANLPACMAALSWTDDVVVLDSFSTDETVTIAERLGARVYQRAFDDFAGQQNDALDQTILTMVGAKLAARVLKPICH